MHLTANPIEVSNVAGKHDDIVELSLGPSGLRIVVESFENREETEYLEVLFQSPRGFRLLDEGDLLAYWQSNALSPRDHTVFEIISGGWMDQERQTPGMLDSTSAFGWFHEWLIVTSNSCVNVIAKHPPIIRRL